MKCVVCGDEFVPKRPWGKFCSSTCRSRQHRGLPTEKDRSGAEKSVYDRTSWKVRQLSIERKEGHGRKWHSSRHADVLRAANLPPNCTVAARVLGISENTLRRRIRLGIPLLQPLRACKYARRKAPVQLKGLTPEQLEQLHVHSTEREILVRQSRDRVKEIMEL